MCSYPAKSFAVVARGAALRMFEQLRSHDPAPERSGSDVPIALSPNPRSWVPNGQKCVNTDHRRCGVLRSYIPVNEMYLALPPRSPPSAPCRLLSSACGEPIIPEICERSPFDSLGILAFLHDYSFSYPHLFRSPTVQQPLSTQVSYRLWQTRCVPQCDRACEHVARCWADASLQDIATNGAASMAATTTPKTKDALISFSHSVSTVPNVPA